MHLGEEVLGASSQGRFYLGTMDIAAKEVVGMLGMLPMQHACCAWFHAGAMKVLCSVRSCAPWAWPRRAACWSWCAACLAS